MTEAPVKKPKYKPARKQSLVGLIASWFAVSALIGGGLTFAILNFI